MAHETIRATCAASIAVLASVVWASGVADVELVPAAALAQPAPPAEHPRLERPAELAGEDAEAVYRDLLGPMVRGYGLADLDAARRYIGWRRFNTAPYRSAQHGDRFVSHYANALAAPLYGSGEPMPVGAVLAKDAFTVTADGDVFPAALALMEKMPPGFDPEHGDWRYTEILPDGSLLGTTAGPDDAQVRFCRACHALVADHDYLFFVPEPWRQTSEEATAPPTRRTSSP